MNKVEVSGLIKGNFEPVSNDGVKFFVSIRDNQKETTEDFPVVAYGNQAERLRQKMKSGQRIVFKGRVSSEKLGTEEYHKVISLERVLAENAPSGSDYAYATISGLGTASEVRTTGSGKQVLDVNIVNKRTYQGKEGEARTYTTYVRASLWGDKAASVEGLLPLTDAPFVVSGQLKSGTYQKNGVDVTTLDIWADEFEIFEGAVTLGEAQAATVAAASAAPAQRRSSPQTSNRKPAF